MKIGDIVERIEESDILVEGNKYRIVKMYRGDLWVEPVDITAEKSKLTRILPCTFLPEFFKVVKIYKDYEVW